MATSKRAILFCILFLFRKKKLLTETFGRSKAYFTAIFTVLFLSNIISQFQKKKYIYPGNIAWATQDSFTITDSVDLALSNCGCLSTYYKHSLSEYYSNQHAFTEYCLKHTLGRIIWMQPTSVCVFGGCTRRCYPKCVHFLNITLHDSVSGLRQITAPSSICHGTTVNRASD